MGIDPMQMIGPTGKHGNAKVALRVYERLYLTTNRYPSFMTMANQTAHKSSYITMVISEVSVEEQ
jgi:hypothetical protein